MSQVILATAGYDHNIRFWEATSGICYRTLQFAESQVNKLEITSNKQFLAAAGNPQIRLFEVNSNNPQAVANYDGHTGNVTAIGFQKDSKWMFSGSEDGTVKIWDLRAPGCQREYASRGAVNTVVLHPNQGELISGKPTIMHHSRLSFEATKLLLNKFGIQHLQETSMATSVCGISQPTRAAVSLFQKLAQLYAASLLPWMAALWWRQTMLAHAMFGA